MRIVIIGSGNVATHLAKAFAKENEVLQIYSKSIANAQLLANAIDGARATDNIKELVPNADLYVISVKDDAIETIVNNVTFDSGLWVHTSGSVTIDILKTKFGRCGVLYPLQTFSRDMDIDISNVPFFIEGCDNITHQEIEKIAQTISNNTHAANSVQRKQLHIAAVFGCNFVNHMWAIADEILVKAGYSFDILTPLIEATLNKATIISPQKGQTGPARRGDMAIINSHQQMLPLNHAYLYHTISNSIISKYINNNE